MTLTVQTVDLQRRNRWPRRAAPHKHKHLPPPQHPPESSRAAWAPLLQPSQAPKPPLMMEPPLLLTHRPFHNPAPAARCCLHPELSSPNPWIGAQMYSDMCWGNILLLGMHACTSHTSHIEKSRERLGVGNLHRCCFRVGAN